MKSPLICAPSLALLICATLTACGGGGSSGDTSTTDQAASTASTDSASGTATAQEATASTEAIVQTTQAVVATSTSGSGISCPNGGTAQYSVSGGADDGSITAGEVYTLSFNNCAGSAGAVALNGQATVTINTATPTAMSATLAINALSATLPRSSVTLNGGATLSTGIRYSRSGNAVNTTLTTSLVASSLSVTRHVSSNSRNTTYALSAVNITQTTLLNSTGGIVSTGLQGTATVSANWPSALYSATFTAQSSVSYVNGLPTSGSWKVTLPKNELDVSAASGTVTVNLDQGKDGTIDRTLTYTVSDWSDSAE